METNGRTERAGSLLLWDDLLSVQTRADPCRSLPPELRLMIYSHLLVDGRDVHIGRRTGHFRPAVCQKDPARCRRQVHELVHIPRCRPPSVQSLSAFVILQRLGIHSQSADVAVQRLQDVYDSSTQERRRQRLGAHQIWPGILGTCRTIYAEGAHVLYGQRFVFATTDCLFLFLSPLGPLPLARLSHIRILGWTDTRSLTSEAVPALALLAKLPNLRRLRLSCVLGKTQDWAWINIFPPRAHETRASTCHELPADILACKVYRDCVHWLRPTFARHGIRGVRSILRISRRNFLPAYMTSAKPMPLFTCAMYQKMQARFWAYLEILLEGDLI